MRKAGLEQPRAPGSGAVGQLCPGCSLELHQRARWQRTPRAEGPSMLPRTATGSLGFRGIANQRQARRWGFRRQLPAFMPVEVEGNLLPFHVVTLPEPGLWRVDHQQDPAAGTRVAQGSKASLVPVKPTPLRGPSASGDRDRSRATLHAGLELSPRPAPGDPGPWLELPSVWVCLCPRGAHYHPGTPSYDS